MPISTSVRRTLAALALAFTATALQAQCQMRTLTLPVRIVDARPIATVGVNGTDLNMLVDSGAFFSMLPHSTAEQLKLRMRSLPDGFQVHGYTGRIEAKLTRVEKVKLQTVEIPDVDFIVGGNELGAGIQGILGRNFLSMADTEYDLAHGVVRLTFPKGDCANTNFAYWAGDAPVIEAPLVKSDVFDTAIRVDTRINGKRVRAMLDTGAPRTALELKIARKAGVKEEALSFIGETGGAGQGKARAWVGTVALFELGGEKIQNNRIMIDDVEHADSDMLIGLDYFLSHRVYVSRLQKTLYATWNGGPIFASTASGGEYDARFAATPQAIAADDGKGLALRAAGAAARGDFAAALADLNRACELEPAVARHWHDRARAHLALRSAKEALADLDTALRLDPGLSEARALRAPLRHYSADRAGALADLQALDTSLPASSPLRSDMADGFSLLNLKDEALKQWALWIPTHRNDTRLAVVLNNRCWLRARLGLELEQALEDCQEAADLNESSGANRDSLGWIHLRLGNPLRARWAFDRSLELRPGSAWSHFGRALALRRLGQLPASEQDLVAARTIEALIDEQVRQEGFAALLDVAGLTASKPNP